eukprot:GILK01004960.1.p1 GENE.GILK01004960.1~~GILK01004960.1.p1  ORF type:complete len:220 (-),score=16.54 GILK01004960.1:101-760(-)
MSMAEMDSSLSGLDDKKRKREDEETCDVILQPHMLDQKLLLSNPSEKKRGRPRIHPPKIVDPNAEKRRRGRPRIHPPPDPNLPKRPRGRPRLHPKKSSDPMSPKRQRGRPRIHPIKEKRPDASSPIKRFKTKKEEVDEEDDMAEDQTEQLEHVDHAEEAEHMLAHLPEDPSHGDFIADHSPKLDDIATKERRPRKNQRSRLPSQDTDSASDMAPPLSFG